nr:hypothetical protein [Prevotella sp.]
MIEYEQFLVYLSSLQHPTFECNGKHYQWTLDGMRDFDSFLGCPSQKLKVIHVAGTNGKGSCSSFIASILISMNLKVGTYNSPQLFDIRERIKINGKMISRNDICEFYLKIKEYTKQGLSTNSKQKRITSYSEVFVAMAFDYFLLNNVDVAVIETGIGGRLDPTNIIKHPLACVITSIGKDHTELLGNDIRNIVLEKCGIMKMDTPMVIGHISDDIKPVICQEATSKHCEVFFTDDFYPYIPDDIKFEHNNSFDLKGNYQVWNVKTALCVFHLLTKIYPTLFPLFQPDIISFALHNTAQITKLRGRWEIAHKFPTIIVDVCSNPFGLKINIEQLTNMLATSKYKRLVFILGLTSIKKISIKDYLPVNAWYIYTESKSFISAQELAREIDIKGDITGSVRQAISLYLENSESDDLVYIGGSIHVVAEALEILK